MLIFEVLDLVSGRFFLVNNDCYDPLWFFYCTLIHIMLVQVGSDSLSGFVADNHGDSSCEVDDAAFHHYFTASATLSVVCHNGPCSKLRLLRNHFFIFYLSLGHYKNNTFINTTYTDTSESMLCKRPGSVDTVIYLNGHHCLLTFESTPYIIQCLY